MATAHTDLGRLERDAYRRFYEDGLFDVFLGAMLVVLGVSAAIADWLQDELLSDVVMLTLVVGITVPLLIVRRRLLRARLGTFEPGPQRRRRIGGTRGILLASVVVGIIAFGVAAAAYSGAAPVDLFEMLIPAIWFVNAVVVFGAMAYFLDVPRFYVYGLLLGSVMPLLMWPDMLWGARLEAWVLFGATGLATIGLGLHKLRHFLQRYPAPQAG